MKPFSFRAQRRHPLCPACSFDLAATLDAGIHRCPECGQPFSLADLPREVLPGDWTPLKGCSSLAIALALRTAALSLVWAAFLFLFHFLLTSSSNSLVAMVVFLYPYVLLPILFVASYAAGRVFGTVFSARLFQITGFTSLLIPFFAVLATLLALLGSLAIVALYEHFTAPSAVFTAIASFGIIYSILRSLLPEC